MVDRTVLLCTLETESRGLLRVEGTKVESSLVTVTEKQRR